MKLLSDLGLQPDFEKDRLGPDLKQLLRVFLVSDWSALRHLKLSNRQVAELRHFLHGFIIYHLGRIPRGRVP